MVIHPERIISARVATSRQTGAPAFAADCIEGLSSARRWLACKWLYDDIGSQLFERITALEEYYPSRVEEALLEDASAHLSRLPGGPSSLVELGSGASRKTRLLLAALGTIKTYVPIDISADELDRAHASLRADYPGLAIVPTCADFTGPIALDLHSLRAPVLMFFPGSTLGNMAPLQAIAFLRAIRDETGADTRLLLGVDLLKDESVLRAAYDDAEGVTAAFNLNLLTRMKRDLDAVIDVGAFRHRAIWNAEEHRIEMHLEATSRQVIAMPGHRFVIEAGETIHTENSYKLSVAQWQDIFESAGWRIDATWQSPAPHFLLALLSIGTE